MAKHKSENDKVTESSENKWQQMEEAEQTAAEEKQEQVKAGMADRSRESLENELVDLRAKVTESKEHAIRVQAEMQNLRRRLERDMENAIRFANEKLVGELLPILDSLTRGMEAVAHDAYAKEGMELTLNLLKEVMKKHGVREISPSSGEIFNPQYHEAMSMIHVEGAVPNTIAAVMQAGFELNGRVLRAAMVCVSK
jgi:molecular chaperone GrpE